MLATVRKGGKHFKRLQQSSCLDQIAPVCRYMEIEIAGRDLTESPMTNFDASVVNVQQNCQYPPYLTL